jgi:hypothetical protein
MALRIKHAVCTLVPVLVLALPAISQAATQPRYTYFEGGWVNVDFDDIDEDGDGFEVGGSVAIHPNFHIVADYADIDLSGNADATVYSIGIGGNLPLRQGLDGIGRVRWINEEIDVGPGEIDEDGYGLEFGLRAMINPRLELNGGVKYVDVDDDNTSLYVGGLYDVVNNFALGADFEFSDDVTTFFLKGRYYFALGRQR